MQFLNWLRTFPQYLLPKRWLTACAGRMAKAKFAQQWAIRWFIRRYNVDLSEAEHSNPSDYPTFNAFFTRALKTGVRPIDPRSDTLISPVDGTLSQQDPIDEGKLIQAKGHLYSVQALLGETCNTFDAGHFLTLYLAPKDYHRVHMPYHGKLTRMRYIPGRLMAVKPSTAQCVPNLFARNERLVMHFDTPIGDLVIVMVGAMIVSGISTQWSGDVGRHQDIKDWDFDDQSLCFDKGELLGQFALGSTVIVLLPNQAIPSWLYDTQQSVRMGQALATIS